MKDKIRSPVMRDISHAVKSHKKGAVGESTYTHILKQLIGLL
jgi:hypothetical protein